MINKIEKFVKAYKMAEPGDRIIAAVSGGADSVCLLLILEHLGKEIPFSLRAVHVHHGLRGEEADRDAEFTRRLCEDMGIPIKILYGNVRELAAKEGYSQEEAGRLLRYQLLEQEAELWEQEDTGKNGGGETAPVKIAAAHHGDDNTETILYHLFRGTGLLGLGGIRPVRGRIVRPLLCVGREDILAYLKERGQTFCLDSTNESDMYTRNRIRNEILPLICREVNARAGEHVRQAGERIRQADDFIRAMARKWLEQRLDTEEWDKDRACRIPDDLLEEPEILQTYVLQCALGKFAGSGKDVTARHIENLRDLLMGPVGRRGSLPGGIRAEREYRFLRLTRFPENAGAGEEKKAPEAVFTVFPREKNCEFPKNQYTKWFDYDKIKHILSVRTRRTGDYITLAGGGKKSVKAYMIDEKIPASQRDSVFLLADENHILWIIGYRISEYYKIGPQTKTILEVQINGGEYHGR